MTPRQTMHAPLHDPLPKLTPWVTVLDKLFSQDISESYETQTFSAVFRVA